MKHDVKLCAENKFHGARGDVMRNNLEKNNIQCISAVQCFFLIVSESEKLLDREPTL